MASFNNTILFTAIPQDKNMEEVPCLISSTSLDGIIVDGFNPDQHSVTAVLNYCKRKILTPYLRLLSFVGLRPIINKREPCLCQYLSNPLYLTALILVILVGYLLQYMACFRRDRGFYYKNLNSEENFFFKMELNQICPGPLFFSFIIPSCLHFFGYVYAVLKMRHSDDDQLPVLMERVFLSSATIANNGTNQKRLVKMLWVFVATTVLWMGLCLFVVNFMMASGTINFQWMEDKPIFCVNFLKGLLVVSTLAHDIVQATIISNYCLQVHFLTIYLQFLQDELLQNPIQTLQWIRHIETFKNMLQYINNEMAPPICVFTFMNMAYSISGILWLLNFDSIDKEIIPIVGISSLNVLLWILITLAPFILAARLSNQCRILRNVGQEVRTRPYVHQDTPRAELDSLLLYTGSLKLSARLFCVPITGKYLCLFFVVLGLGVLVLGQCHYLNIS